jgi:hypothetical protein
MVFHVQLNIRNWISCQLDVAETECLPPPDFCQGLHMLEVQNNLMWLPTVTNVPALLALRVVTRASTTRAGSPSTNTDTGPGGANIGGGSTLGAAAGAATRRDPGAQVRNPNRDSRFVGSTPFARMVRIRSVALAIAAAGSDPPQVVRMVSPGNTASPGMLATNVSNFARWQWIMFPWSLRRQRLSMPGRMQLLLEA